MTFLLTTDLRMLNYLKSKYETAQRNAVLIEQLVNTVHQQDACEFLRKIPDKSVDLVLTDEPYGVAPTRLNLKARSDITTKFEWDRITELPDLYKGLLHGAGPEEPRLPADLLSEWVFEASPTLKDNGFLVNFGQSEFIASFRDICRYAGLTWKASIPWIKVNVAPHFRKSNFRSGFETIYFAAKGKTKGEWNFLEQQEMVNFILDQRCPNCNASFPVVFSNNYDHPRWFEEIDQWIEISPMTNKKTNHPTEKPEWLITKLMTIMSNKGYVIVDPFSGSGTTAIVAKKMGRKYIVNDLNLEWAEYTAQRLKNQIISLI